MVRELESLARSFTHGAVICFRLSMLLNITFDNLRNPEYSRSLKSKCKKLLLKEGESPNSISFICQRTLRDQAI